jgi:hypothetical protein
MTYRIFSSPICVGAAAPGPARLVLAKRVNGRNTTTCLSASCVSCRILVCPRTKRSQGTSSALNLICLFRVPWNKSNFHHPLFWFTEGLCSIGRKRPVPSDLSETVRHRQGLLAGLSGAPRSPALLSGRVVISDHGTPSTSSVRRKCNTRGCRLDPEYMTYRGRGRSTPPQL